MDQSCFGEPAGRPPVRTDGGDDTPDDDPAGDADGDDSIEGLLRAAGVLELTPDGTDLRLTDEFAQAWHDRIDQMRGSDRALRWLAASEGIEPDEITVNDAEDRYVVTHEGETVGAWHSEAGFLAGIVAEPTIREWIDEDGLAQLPELQREELAARLVMCLEQCPGCGETLVFAERALEDGRDGVALQCRGCDSTVAVGAAE